MTIKFWGSYDQDESGSWDDVYLTPQNGKRFKLPGIARVSVDQSVEVDTTKGSGKNKGKTTQISRNPININVSLEIKEKKHHDELESYLVKLTEWLRTPTVFTIEHPYAQMWKVEKVVFNTFNTPAPNREEGMTCSLQLIEYNEKLADQKPAISSPTKAKAGNPVKQRGVLDQIEEPQTGATP